MKILPAEFDGHAIRRSYDEATKLWWFSVVDVVQVLTDSANARRYWSDLKRKLALEAGSAQPYENRTVESGCTRWQTAPDGCQLFAAKRNQNLEKVAKTMKDTMNEAFSGEL